MPIEVAADRVNRRHGGETISTFGLLLNQLTGGSTSLDAILGGVPGVDPADLRGDAHGGAVETSILLHLLGEGVRPGWQSLPQRTVDIKLREQAVAPIETPGKRPGLPQLIRGFRHKIKYFEDETYAGKPSVASAEKGAAFVDIPAEHAAAALEEVVNGTRKPDACYSPLWRARHLFVNEPLGRAFECLVGYRNRVF